MNLHQHSIVASIAAWITSAIALTCLRASAQTPTDATQPRRDSISQSPRNWSISVVGGPVRSTLSWEFPELFRFLTFPMNWEAAGVPSHWGTQAAVRATKFVSTDIALGLGAEYLHLNATFHYVQSPWPMTDTTTGVIHTFTRDRRTSFTIDEFAVAPFVRFSPRPSVIFIEAGATVGGIVAQKGDGEQTRPSPTDVFPKEIMSNRSADTLRAGDTSTPHLGTPRVQFALMLGAGGLIDLGAGITLELAVRVQFGLNRLFRESATTIENSVEPAIGLSVALP